MVVLDGSKIPKVLFTGYLDQKLHLLVGVKALSKCERQGGYSAEADPVEVGQTGR